MKRKIFKIAIKTKFILFLGLTGLNAHATSTPTNYKTSSKVKASIKFTKNHRLITEQTLSNSSNKDSAHNKLVTIPNNEDDDLNIIITKNGSGSDNIIISDDHDHCFKTDETECNLKIAGHDLDLSLQVAFLNSSEEINNYEILILQE